MDPVFKGQSLGQLHTHTHTRTHTQIHTHTHTHTHTLCLPAIMRKIGQTEGTEGIK